MNKKYEIELRGCDDSNLITVHLTDEEFNVINELCKLSIITSEYNCQPRMFIEEAK